MTINAKRESFFPHDLLPHLAHKRFVALERILHPDAETGDTTLYQHLYAEYDAFCNSTLQISLAKSQLQTSPSRPRYVSDKPCFRQEGDTSQYRSSNICTKNEPEPLQVTITQAARMLGYSKSKIYDLINRGEIKTVERGRLRRIAIEELRRWQHENEG